MAGSDASEGQAVRQPGGAEEDSRLREGNRHLHLAYAEEEEERMSWTDLLLWGTVDWDTQHLSCSWLHCTCPGGYRCRVPLCGSCCPPVCLQG